MESVVKSAARVLEVFEYFAARRGPATVSDICTALGYPQSSTSVLLKSLSTLGYLNQDPASRRYSPTPRVALLGEWLALADDLPQLMQRVAAATGQPVMLAQRTGPQIQYIKLLEAGGAGENPPELRAGARVPLFASAAGIVLLSLGSDEEALRGLRRAQATGEQPGEPELLARLREARATGIVTMGRTAAEPYGVVAAALSATEGQPRVAIAVATPKLEQNEQRIVEALREHAGASIVRAAESIDPTARLPRTPVSGLSGLRT